MQNKLQELTKKIYQEGVEKGNSEARQILEKAKSEAASIIENSKKEAEAILTDAKKKAAELKSNTEADIKLSAKQAVNALKKQILDIISNDIVEAKVKSAFDKDFLKKTIITTLANWAKSGQTMDIAVLLPAEDEKELNEYFKKEIKDYIAKGVSIQFDPSVKTGFQLGPKDGSYKVSFTDEDFTNFFKQYLRPRIIDFLFEG